MNARLNESVTADVKIDFKDFDIYRGKVWNFGSGSQSIADSTYIVMYFTTPATGLVSIEDVTISKSGMAITAFLLEHTTFVVAAASALAGHNLNRNKATPDTHPLGSYLIGASANGNTVSGGTTIIPTKIIGGDLANNDLLAGESKIISKPIYCKPSENYALVIASVGGTTTATASMDVKYDEKGVI